MKIAVLGAGPGALALSASLIMKNHSVNLYELSEFSTNISELVTTKEILIDGYLKGSAKLNLATTVIDEAVADVSHIFIVTHAAAHTILAEKLAPLLNAKQYVILFPGYVAGALSFGQEFRKKATHISPLLAESSVLPFACRRTGPCSVFVGGWKQDFILGTQEELFDFTPINDLFGDVPISRNPFEPGLNETNFIIHTCISLSNIGLVESGEDWSFYRQGLSAGVGRLIEAIDQERLLLLQRLGLPQISLCEWLLRFYQDQGAQGTTAYEVLTGYNYFATSKGPKSFLHRYFSEDISYGLVPMATLGKMHQVPMPLTNALIDFAGGVTGIDYRTTGRQI